MKKQLLILSMFASLTACSQVTTPYQCTVDSVIFMPFNTTSEDRNYHNNHQQFQQRCYVNNTGYTQYIYNSDNFNNWTDINFVAEYGDIHIKKNINHTENKNISYKTTEGYTIYVDKISSLERNTNIFIDGEVYIDHININADSIGDISVVYFTERSKFSLIFFPSFTITNSDIVSDTIINTHTSGASAKFIHFRKIPPTLTNVIIVDAQIKDNFIFWSVTSTEQVKQINIEYSKDAINFASLHTTNLQQGVLKLAEGYKYLQIRVITVDGTIKVSRILKNQDITANKQVIKYIDITGRVYRSETDIPTNIVYFIMYSDNTTKKIIKTHN